MAGIIAALVIGGASGGIDKIKSKRAERKARRQQLESEASSPTDRTSTLKQDDDDSRGIRFAESKAREASQERRRRESDGEGEELNTHPALREPSQLAQGTRADAETANSPPPPYVKDPPSYEEHISQEQNASTGAGQTT